MNPELKFFRGEVFCTSSAPEQLYVFQGTCNGQFTGCKLQDLEGMPGIVQEHLFTRDQMKLAVKMVEYVVSGIYADPVQLYITSEWLPEDATHGDILRSAHATCVRDNGFDPLHDCGKPTTWDENPEITFVSIMATLPGALITTVVWSQDPWSK